MGKNLPANGGDARDMGSISGLGRSPGGGHGNPLQYSCLEDPMDRGPRQTDWRTFREGPLARRLLIFAWGRGPSLIWGVTKKGWGIHIDLD